jgi:CRISPR-associated protein Csx16
MKTFLVTRHDGAVEWAQEQGLKIDQKLEHLEIAQVREGDCVIGSLPVNLAAEVCKRGGRYLHLSLDLPPELRGQELNAEQMRRSNARIEEYLVQRVE